MKRDIVIFDLSRAQGCLSQGARLSVGYFLAAPCGKYIYAGWREFSCCFFISGIEVLEVATPRATQPVTFVLAIYSGWKAFSPVLSVQHAIRLESVQFGVCR